MFDINLVALIVLLNEPQAQMAALVPKPQVGQREDCRRGSKWSGWRHGPGIIWRRCRSRLGPDDQRGNGRPQA